MDTMLVTKGQTMINRFSTRPLQAAALMAVAAVALSALVAGAQDSSTTTTTTVQTTSTAAPVPTPAVPQLSSGVADVLKLSQAKVSDDTVVAYVQASDRGYGALSASEIAYLHQAGVSDVVVKAMLDKRKGLAEANAQMAQAQSPAAQPAPAAAPSVWQTTASAPAPAYTPPAVTYVEPAPSTTVYYVPNTPMFPGQPYYYYPGYGYGYGGYGYGYGYRGYYGPSLSLSFGFGGGYRGGYYGGYHGGHGGGHHR